MGRGKLLPLVITADFVSPVLFDTLPHMDSILTEKIGGRHGLIVEGARRGDDPSIFADINLPLARVERDGEKIWASSAAIFHIFERFDYWWVRRRDSYDIEMYEKKLKIGSGPDRNMMLRRTGFVAPYAQWIVIGNRQEIRRTLKLVSAIGAKRGHGLGAVRKWTVEYLPEDADPLCWLYDSRGIVLRHVPTSWMGKGQQSFGAVRSPYFLNAYQQPVVRLGSFNKPKPWLVEAGKTLIENH